MKHLPSILLTLFFCSLAQALEKPNLVVIFTDDQVYNAIGYDNPEVHTPHLDALAASGMIFERTYAASPICAASRASAMTGLFPQQHGTVGLGTKPFHQQYWKGGEKASRTLASMLSEAGYHTAAHRATGRRCSAFSRPTMPSSATSTTR